VEGLVQDETRAPVAGALVTVADRDEARARDEGTGGALSRADGRFRIDGLSPGPVTLVARKGSLVAETELDVPSSDETSEAVLTLRGKGTIVGALRGADGRPMTGEVQAGGTLAATDTQGHYRLDGIVPGPTTLLALFENNASATRQVAVEAGQTVRVDFDLAAGATLQITVAGQPTGEVHVLRTDVGAPAASAGLSDRQTAEIVRGEGVVKGLPGGRYTVVFMNELLVAEGIVEVPPQGTASIALAPKSIDETRILPP
jgi:hypothetical protein